MTIVSVSLFYLNALSRADGIFDINPSHLCPRVIKFYSENSRDKYVIYLYQLGGCCKLPITVKYCEDKGGFGLEFKSQHIHEPESHIPRSCFLSAHSSSIIWQTFFISCLVDSYKILPHMYDQIPTKFLWYQLIFTKQFLTHGMQIL